MTGITKKDEVYLKHFYDSLTLNKIINLSEVKTLCDLGSGAGFPGIVLKIVFPQIEITLVDSLNKRINFLNLVISELGLKKIKTVEMFNIEKLDQKDYNYICNARSIALLQKSLKSLDSVEEGINNNVPIDMVEIDLKDVWSTLGEIIGENYSDELIDQLFSQFCLGK